MYSIGLALTLRPGCYPDYKKHHDEIWPQITKGMADNDVAMAIFRHGDTLFVHAAAPTEEHWNRSRADPILEKWNDLMKTLLATDADGNIVFELLEPAFEFGLFKADQP